MLNDIFSAKSWPNCMKRIILFVHTPQKCTRWCSLCFRLINNLIAFILPRLASPLFSRQIVSEKVPLKGVTVPVLRLEKFFLVGLATLALSTGCTNSVSTSMNTNSEEPNPLSLSAEEVRTFNQNKARLDKLASLEADMATLLTELSKHANVSEKPARFRNTPATEQIYPSFSVADDEDDSGNEHDSPSSFTAVLGEYLTEQSAIAAAQEINENFNIAALNMSFAVSTTKAKPGYYAVILGNFSSQKIANLLCQAFAKHNQFCSAELDTFSPRVEFG